MTLPIAASPGLAVTRIDHTTGLGTTTASTLAQVGDKIRDRDQARYHSKQKHTMQTSATTKVRKRRSRESHSEDNSGSGDDGKKRGRPRVEKADESAADVGQLSATVRQTRWRWTSS